MPASNGLAQSRVGLLAKGSEHLDANLLENLAIPEESQVSGEDRLGRQTGKVAGNLNLE